MFGDRRGALVALDPRSGEVLAFVSKPTFDPNLFVDGIDSESWKELNESVDKPLLNRALRGTYPPGSTFKPFMAIAALNSGKRSPSQVIFDGGTFQFGNHTFRSHGDAGLGPVDMVRSIVKSSNVYYYSLANEMGVDLMHDQLEPFGFGRKTGIDVEGEVTGLLPSTEVEAQGLQEARAAEVVRRRDHLAGHRPGLQQLHHAAAGQRHGDAGVRRPALQAATGARGGGRGHRRAPRAGQRRAAAAAAQARARGADQPCVVRRDAGGHLGALLPRRALQERRQDRHRAGHRRERQREVQRRQARGGPARPLAVHRLRAAGGAQHRGGGDRRERGLGLRLRCADVAPRVRLRAQRHRAQRGGSGAHARGQVDHAGGQAARPAIEVLLPGAATIALPPAVPATQRVAQGESQGAPAK